MIWKIQKDDRFTLPTRDLLFTNPVFTNYLEIEVLEPLYTDLNLKLDFIGMTREKMHSRERINQPDRVVKDVISPYRCICVRNCGYRVIHMVMEKFLLIPNLHFCFSVIY